MFDVQAMFFAVGDQCLTPRAGGPRVAIVR